MGVHSNAERIVREFGFNPQMSSSSHKLTGGSSALGPKADVAVKALEEFLTVEGMVRIYALLKSATTTSHPKFDIGSGPRALANAMEKKLKGSREQQEMVAEIKKMQDQLADLTKRLKAAH